MEIETNVGEGKESEPLISSSVWELFCLSVIDIPSDDVRNRMARLAFQFLEHGVIEEERCIRLVLHPSTVGDDERQEYHDRFFVPSSARYTPLVESRIRRSKCLPSGLWSFDSAGGRYERQVEEKYRNAGFDCRRLSGYGPFLAMLKPDNVAAETAFMAFLRRDEHLSTDEAVVRARGCQAKDFLESNLCCWTDRLAEVAKWTGDDYYAGLFSILAAWAKLDTDCETVNG